MKHHRLYLGILYMCLGHHSSCSQYEEQVLDDITWMPCWATLNIIALKKCVIEEFYKMPLKDVHCHTITVWLQDNSTIFIRKIKKNSLRCKMFICIAIRWSKDLVRWEMEEQSTKVNLKAIWEVKIARKQTEVLWWWYISTVAINVYLQTSQNFSSFTRPKMHF